MRARVALLFLLGLAYSLAMPPGLTWGHFSADSGDLITAAATGGVPHPSGYPLYLLLAWLFQQIPFGPLAVRTHILSMFAALAAALLLHEILARRVAPLPAFLGALVFGLAPLIWGQAIVTEVYALHLALLLLFWNLLDTDPLPFPDWMRGLAFGLALSNHLTTLLCLPLLLLDIPSMRFAAWPALLRRFLGLLPGLGLYATLSLRALYGNSPVMWGDPSTPAGLLWLVSGQLYGTYLFQLTPAETLDRLRTLGTLAVQQFTLPGFILGLYGFISSPPRRWLLPAGWMLLAYPLFALFYATGDSQTYLLPAIAAFCAFLAWGLDDLLKTLQSRSARLAQVTGILLVLAFLAYQPFSFSSISLAQDLTAEQFGTRFRQDTPQNALIFADSDPELFSLWYFHFALGHRPDVVVISEGLLPFDWYLRTLHRTYPTLSLPSLETTTPFEIIVNNPTRPVCNITESAACR